MLAVKHSEDPKQFDLQRSENMTRIWMSSAILAAILIGSAPVLGHEECDEDESKVAGAASEKAFTHLLNQTPMSRSSFFNFSRVGCR